MPVSIGSAYRGPLVIIGLGGGFSVVGAVPVAITFSIGVKTSATIIGMGFVGFGFLLILPGLFWCLMVRTHSFKFWRRKRRSCTVSSTRKRHDDDEEEEDDDEEEETPALNNSCINSRFDKDHQTLNSSGAVASVSAPRAKERGRWPPPVYIDTPPLIITDHCAATNALQVDALTSSSDVAPPFVTIDFRCNDADCQMNNNNVNTPIDNTVNAAAAAAAAALTADADNNNREDLSTNPTHCNFSSSPLHSRSLSSRIEPTTMLNSF